MSNPGGERFVCIHGHFYQPPRENPWLEAVEVQDSAAPYHDWNQRIAAECYGPNAAARLLDEQGQIVALRNNYSRISFNFGPTLLAWLEHAQPEVYGQVQAADRDSARYFGRGSALAQAYGHCIMPLASPRDQETQVRWGIADFVHRFGRVPDGMWLPETAVDRKTLAVLAENGIRFTILAPSQAARVRYDGRQWEPVRDGGIDCQRPYHCTVGHGQAITLFFYDAGISHAIAFGGLLNDGRQLAQRLTAAALGRQTHKGTPPLVHIATDGESYGHHHRFGEMALSAAIEAIEHEAQIRLTNYASHLDRVRVVDEVEICENSSWSCAHGVERWRADCGCHISNNPGWRQAWRAPLRHSLNWLQAQLDTVFEQQASNLLRDPWAARDAYIGLILRRDAERRGEFLQRHAFEAAPDAATRTRIWKLLEMQRYTVLSFTSCGWFFDEPTGLETTQVLTYAARAVQLASQLGVNLEPEFLHRLQALRSNLPEYGDGRQIYRQIIRPQITDNSRVAAHYAMHSLFVPADAEAHVYAYRVHSLDRVVERSGATAFALGKARLRSEATEENFEFAHATLHLGGHDMHCAVSRMSPEYPVLRKDLLATFFAEPLSELVRRIDHAFGGVFYTLRHLFVAERRRVLDHLTAQVVSDCSADYERIVSSNRRLLDFLTQAGVPLPPELALATRFVVQHRLEQAVTQFVSGAGDGEHVLAVWEDAHRWAIVPEMDKAGQLLEQALVRAINAVLRGDAQGGLARAHAILDLAQPLKVTLNLWEAQNHYYAMITTAENHPWAADGFAELTRLGERLSFRLREWDMLKPAPA